MTNENKKLVGPILAILGGGMLVFTAINILYRLVTIDIDWLESGGYTLADVGADLYLLGITMTIVIGLFSIIAGILVIKDFSVAKYLLLSAGIIAVIGMLIPIVTAEFVSPPDYPRNPMNLIISGLMYIDPILVLLGGIITMILSSVS